MPGSQVRPTLGAKGMYVWRWGKAQRRLAEVQEARQSWPVFWAEDGVSVWVPQGEQVFGIRKPFLRAACKASRLGEDSAV